MFVKSSEPTLIADIPSSNRKSRSDLFCGVDKKSMIYFSRLAINDLSIKGNQPFEFGNYLLVANCEIYNFQELRSKLVDKYKFKSNSDAEVLLYSFVEWGEEFVK